MGIRVGRLVTARDNVPIAVRGLVNTSAESTNAIIAASCANECLKCLTYCSKPLDNWFSYQGRTMISSSVLAMERNEDCPVCNLNGVRIDIEKAMKVKDFVEVIEKKINFKNLTIMTEDAEYFAASGVLAKSHEAKLEMTIGELIEQKKINPNLKITVWAGGCPKDFNFLPTYI